MSHFSATLNQILHAKPNRSHEAWAEQFGIYPAHLTMMSSGGGALGHKVIAKIACHLSQSDREKLITAYFLDECASLEKEGSTLIPGKLGWDLPSLLKSTPGKSRAPKESR